MVVATVELMDMKQHNKTRPGHNRGPLANAAMHSTGDSGGRTLPMDVPYGIHRKHRVISVRQPQKRKQPKRVIKSRSKKSNF